jgi:lipopolysaccharide transport system permease protein
MNSLWLRIRPLLSTLVRFTHISYIEAKSEYERTRIGIFWIPLSTLIFTVLLGLVFHTAGAMGQVHFYLYVLAGYICWNFVSDSISGSVEVIQKRLDFAVHNGLTLAGLFGKTLVDRLFEFGLNLPLLLIATLILSPQSYGPQILLFLPLLAMLCVTSLAASYMTNLLTVYFPDLKNVIRTAMRFLFFATPIFWSAAERSGIRVALERYNPASYFLKMMRQVFGIDPVGWHIWGVGLAITVVTGLAGYVAYRLSNRFVRNLK